MANPALSIPGDRRRAVPVPIGRERMAELLHRPSDALNGYRLTAGEMAWLLKVALASHHGDDDVQAQPQ